MVADSPRVVNVPTSAATRAFLERMLLETPLKRTGYEDARRGRPSRVDCLSAAEGVKYEEGRMLAAELAAISKAVAPPWPDPPAPVPAAILDACERWMEANPGGSIVPPTFEAVRGC